MVINYGGLYPAVPEVTAERPMGATTTTGMLYWLLHQ
jgi:hypothetical protein